MTTTFHRRADSPAAEYRIHFGAGYVYSPQGTHEVSRHSRLLCARVKAGNRKWLRRYVAALQGQRELDSFLTEISLPGTIAIPIPPSRCSQPTVLWPSHLLTCAMHHTGLGVVEWAGVRRLRSVVRSSDACRWERPSVSEHYRSFQIAEAAMPPARIVLIDDVITKGRTLMAAALRLHDAFPYAQIRAFALVRTLGLIEEISQLIKPCEGEISWNGIDAYRRP